MGRRSFLLSAFAFALVLGLAVPGLAAAITVPASGTGTGNPLAVAPGGQGQQDIDWPWVVYKDGRYDELDMNDQEPHVRLYNMQTGDDFPVSPDNEGWFEQANPSIYGTKVVYSDQRNYDDTDCDIRMYDIETGLESTICAAPDGQGNPFIYGDKIVWTDRRNQSTTGNDIYMYDLASHSESAICTDTYSNYEPVIWENLIAWYSWEGSGGGVYLHDLTSGETTCALEGGYFPTADPDTYSYDYYYDPSIADGKLVARNQYLDVVDGSGSWEYRVVMYDTASSQVTTLSTGAPTNISHPVIRDGWVTWNQDDQDSYNDDVWGYNLATHETTELVPYVSDPLSYAGRTATGNGWLLWQDHRAGDGDDTRADIYAKFIGVDVLAPVVQDDAGTAYPSTTTTVSVNISAYDPGEIVTGVDYITYQVDSSSVTTVSGTAVTVDVTGFGTHTVTYSATDRYGNKSADQTATFTIALPITLNRTGYATASGAAVLFSRASWTSASVVVLARDDSFYDAFAASGLAGSYGAPVLLTGKSRLYTSTKNEIKRLKAKKVFVIGGTLAMRPSVVTSLKKMGVTVERLGGGDRYETSVLIGKRIKKHDGSKFSDYAIVANGAGWKSGISSSALAYQLKAPVILVRKDSYKSSVKSFVATGGFKQLIVVGPSASVYTSTASRLAKAGRASWVRAGGTSRYDTAEKVGRLTLKFSATRAKTVGLVSGEKWQFAAVAGPAIAKKGGMMMVTDPYKLSRQTRGLLEDCGSSVKTITLMGDGKTPTTSVGNAAVSAAMP